MTIPHLDGASQHYSLARTINTPKRYITNAALKIAFPVRQESTVSLVLGASCLLRLSWTRDDNIINIVEHHSFATRAERRTRF